MAGGLHGGVIKGVFFVFVFFSQSLPLDKQSGLWSLEWPLEICDLQNFAFFVLFCFSCLGNITYLYSGRHPPPPSRKVCCCVKFKTTNGTVASNWRFSTIEALLPAFCLCRQIITILNTNVAIQRALLLADWWACFFSYKSSTPGVL